MRALAADPQSCADRALDIIGTALVEGRSRLVRAATRLVVRVSTAGGEPADGVLLLRGYERSFAWPPTRDSALRLRLR